MEISRSAATAKGPAETFTGEVWRPTCGTGGFRVPYMEPHRTRTSGTSYEPSLASSRPTTSPIREITRCPAAISVAPVPRWRQAGVVTAPADS